MNGPISRFPSRRPGETSKAYALRVLAWLVVVGVPIWLVAKLGVESPVVWQEILSTLQRYSAG